MIVVPVEAPFNFELSVRLASAYSVLGSRYGDGYRRLFRAGSGLALVELRADDDQAVRANVIAASGKVDEDRLWADVHHLIHPQAERLPFYQFAAASPITGLGETVDRLYGLHHFRFESLYDALIVTMIEQQISLRAAQLAERWLCAWGGDSLDFEGQTYFVFPKPERLARATVEELTPTKITFIRMRRLIEVARMTASGELDAERLRDAPFAVTYPALVALNGVGHWTAAWTIIRAMGHFVYFGRADVALRSAVNRYFFGQKGRIDPNVMDALFAGFGEYAGIASYYTIMRYALEQYPQHL